LRQILVRIQALPTDAPLQLLLAHQEEEIEMRREQAERDQALAPFERR
jgi:hypothetical protein